MLNRHVLILNQNYEPMSVCTAKKAIILLYLGKAEIVERHEQWVRSVTVALPLPSIVRLERYIRVPHKRILLTRKNILKRDHHRCQYCGRDDKPLTIDHVIPKERGGQDVWENLIAACTDCNNRKRNRTPEEAGMHLLKKPRKPNYLTFIQHYIGISDDRWRPYLFLS